MPPLEHPAVFISTVIVAHPLTSVPRLVPARDMAATGPR